MLHNFQEQTVHEKLYLAFRDDDIRVVWSFPFWTSRPGQRTLEALEEVVQAPANNGIIIKSHVEGDHSAGDSNASHIGTHEIPSTYGTLPQALSDSKFHIETRYALDSQHDEIRNKKGSYNK